jgi:hypothetical protein
MARLKIKFLETDVECKGSEEFISEALPRFLELVTKSHNAALKGRLFTLVTELEAQHASIDEHVRNISLTISELGQRFETLREEQEKAIDSIIKLHSDSDQLLSTTKLMQETQMSFNLQYLQLQMKIQNENRQYTIVSNIMKTKHDTVKNSISNIR